MSIKNSVIAPCIATPEMLNACRKAMSKHVASLSEDEIKALPSYRTGGVRIDQDVKFQIRYQAMLAARPEPHIDTHDVLMGVTAALAATISLLERTPQAKKAAPSDTMFAMMLDDYRAQLAKARAYFGGSDDPV